MITVNLYYKGQNGSARAFADEMEKSGIADAIRAEEGNLTVIVTLVLEHCFTIAKILGSIVGCLVVAFLCYELSDVTPMNTRLVITGVGTVIAILLNIRFWRK